MPVLLKRILVVTVAAEALLLAIGLPSNAQSSSRFCDPIGRIIDGTSQSLDSGQLACLGDRIINPVDVQLLCFSNNTVIHIEDNRTIDSHLCNNPAPVTNTISGCAESLFGRLFCRVPKGPEDEVHFAIIEPQSNSENLRPGFEWEPMPRAESYTIGISGPGLSWSYDVSAEVTQFQYPENEESLIAGNAYTVVVVAHQSSDEAFVASKIVNVSSTSASSASVISLRLE